MKNNPAIRVKVSEYRRTYFAPGSSPDPRTVIARIKRGEILGEREGRLWYVYPHLKPSADHRLNRLIAEFNEDL